MVQHLRRAGAAVSSDEAPSVRPMRHTTAESDLRDVERPVVHRNRSQRRGLVRRVNDADGDDGLPDVEIWAARLMQAVAEVLAGDRAVGQLIRWTDSVVYAELDRRVRLLGLTTTAGRRGTSARAFVRSVHVAVIAEGVAEVAAHVRHNGCSRALALRLEIHRNRWICTALTLG